MSRFVISFYSDAQGVYSKVLEAPSKEEALRSFFDFFVADYSKDSEGFAWFREDFFDDDRPLGAILELD